MIKTCDCKHEYQDEKYDKGKRVQNPTAKGYRCTVCGKTTIEENLKLGEKK